MQTGAPVQDAFVEMIGPIGAPLVSYGALISIAGLNIGESSWSSFWCRISTSKTLARRAWKTNSKNALSLPLSSLVSSLSYSCYLKYFRIISNLQCCLPFLPIHSNCFGSYQTQKNVPRQKVTFRVPFWSRYLSSSRCGQYLDDCRDNMMNFVWGAIGLVIASGLCLFPGDKLHKSKALPSLIFFTQ